MIGGNVFNVRVQVCGFFFKKSCCITVYGKKRWRGGKR